MDAAVEYFILFVVATAPLLLCLLAFWLMLKRTPGWGWLLAIVVLWMLAAPTVRVHVDTSKPTCAAARGWDT